MKSIPPQALAEGHRFRQDADLTEAAEDELDTIAWRFLASEFTGLTYANWPIDRRVDAYLAHHGMTHLLNNGDTHQAVVQRVLANIGAALRSGILPTTTCCRSREGVPETPAAETMSPDRDALRLAKNRNGSEVAMQIV